jgi:hypothetical protein
MAVITYKDRETIARLSRDFEGRVVPRYQQVWRSDFQPEASSRRRSARKREIYVGIQTSPLAESHGFDKPPELRTAAKLRHGLSLM